MKRSLQEELEKIHSITYGKKVINEGIIDTILQKVGLKKSDGKKEDDPTKADFVSDDVKQFFSTLENIKTDIQQQTSGGYEYQKDVESVQIGLKILGYDLPKYGVDGKYGPETAAAVQKFKQDNNLENKSSNGSSGEQISESILVSILDDFKLMKEAVQLVRLDDTSYSNVRFDRDGTQYDEVNKALLDDLQKAASAAGVVATITTAKTGHGFFTKSGHKSRHMSKTAVDIAILDGQGAKGASNPNNGNPSFREKGNLLKDALVQLGYTWNTESGNPKAVLWQTDTGGNHYNHLHVSNNSGASTAELDAMSLSGGGGSLMSPEDIKVLVDKLKQKGVTSEELKVYIDSVLTGGGAEFTDIDLNTTEGFDVYTEICQKFISTNGPNPLGITGEMMAKGAKEAFMRYQRYVPPELALSQLVLEGGIRNDKLESRPIRTKNPFNVGNTDSGANVEHNEVQSGINAYYNLVARNYLGKGKTAKDLITNFVNKNGNRYATAPDYEKQLNVLASQARRIATPVIAKVTSQKSSSAETIA